MPEKQALNMRLAETWNEPFSASSKLSYFRIRFKTVLLIRLIAQSRIAFAFFFLFQLIPYFVLQYDAYDDLVLFD